MTKYYFCLDVNTQWFCKLLVIEEDKDLKFIDFNYHSGGEFLSSITARDVLTYDVNKTYTKEYYCWSISFYEYNRLLRINELYPKVLEYTRLIGLS